MRENVFSLGLRMALITLAGSLLVTSSWAASARVLHNFDSSGTDGFNPEDSLIFDAAGNLYGTTSAGGKYHVGTVFELTPQTGGNWSEKILHSFIENGKDGNFPLDNLIFDTAGNLYGTTWAGGTHNLGTIFELTPQAGGGWIESVLHSFGADGKDGNTPYAGLTFDAAGNLYGTTSAGGAYNLGTVFQLAPKEGGTWTERVLYHFKMNGQDGVDPEANLIFDAAGNLYGTTDHGGANGSGTVFELTLEAGGRWTEKVLHSFGSGTDGILPQAGVIFDTTGNLYGATFFGGDHGYGTAFELTPQAGGGWTEIVLHSFNDNGEDGYNPYASLVFGASGNLYGTTSAGGTNGFGTVFELTPEADGNWTEKVLYHFVDNGKSGYQPYSALIFDGVGNLYCTTYGGGSHGGGTVSELTP